MAESNIDVDTMMPDQKKDYFIKKFLQRLMGSQLDQARLTPMNERQFKQFERTTRNDFNTIIELFQKNLQLTPKAEREFQLWNAEISKSQDS